MYGVFGKVHQKLSRQSTISKSRLIVIGHQKFNLYVHRAFSMDQGKQEDDYDDRKKDELMHQFS